MEDTIKDNVTAGATISTDEWSGYANLGKLGFEHGTVNHHKDERVSCVHHTNSIEGHWSQLKRSIRGTHVHVSSKHLWKYANEFSYRRNMRYCHHTMFTKLIDAISLPRLAES